MIEELYIYHLIEKFNHSTEYKHVIDIPSLKTYTFSKIGLIYTCITNRFLTKQRNDKILNYILL